jgi:hypothetical protein
VLVLFGALSIEIERESEDKNSPESVAAATGSDMARRLKKMRKEESAEGIQGLW